MCFFLKGSNPSGNEHPCSLPEGSAFGSSNAFRGARDQCWWWERFHRGSGLRLFIPLHHFGFAWFFKNNLTIYRLGDMGPSYWSSLNLCIITYIAIHVGGLMQFKSQFTAKHSWNNPSNLVIWDLHITSTLRINYILFELPHSGLKKFISICTRIYPYPNT